MDENAPKTCSVSMNLSWTGPGLPDKAGTLEFVRSLGRRELSIAVGILVFVFVVEPLILYMLFSAKLKDRLAEHTDRLSASLASHISAEVGAAVRDQLARQQQSQVTPLKASDPTSLVMSPNAPPTPSPAAGKP